MREEWDNLNALLSPLLTWYDANRRSLPWREEVTPYRTWVSEIMLQQTRVSAVIPYFTRFVSELPDAAALAAVPQERLYKLWEGLGYYSRARNLQKAAQILVRDRDGELPHTARELQTLPGIGAYTAAAIASICFGEPVAAVDGNLLRVAARVSGCAEDITLPAVRKKFTEKLNAAVSRDRPGAYNQAMMDLGAAVCLPNGAPLCEKCPARGCCAALRAGLTETLPVRGERAPRRAEELTVFLLRQDGKLAVRQRPERGLLASLTEFPNAPGSLDEAGARIVLAEWGLTPQTLAPLGTAKHTFTHVEWQMKGWFSDVAGDAPGFRWVTRPEFDALAIPGAFRRFAALAREKV